MTVRRYDPKNPTAGLPKECLMCQDDLNVGEPFSLPEIRNVNGKPVNLCGYHGRNWPEWEDQQQTLV